MRPLYKAIFALLSYSAIASPSSADVLEHLSHRDRLYDATEHQKTVWVVGYPGLLLRSDNEGASFSRVSIPTNDALFAIDFNASGVGAAVGRSGLVLVTEDHGSTWKKYAAFGVPKPKTEEEGHAETPAHLFGVNVLDNGHIVAVGDFGTIVVSKDRGATFQKRTFSVGVEPFAGGNAGAIGGLSEEEETAGAIEEARLGAVSFADSQTGYAVGEFGLILRTQDGGETWTRQASNTGKLLFSVHARAKAQVVVVGSEGTLLESADGGTTWQTASTGQTLHLFDVRCEGARCAFSGQEGSVFIRDEPGASLRRVQTAALAPLSGITFVGTNGWVVVGSRGYVLRAKQGDAQFTRVLGE